MKQRGEAYLPPDHYKDIEMPKNSVVGPLFAVAGAMIAFALVWYIWWMVVVGLFAMIGAVIGRSFVKDTKKIIPAEEVRREHERWLRAVHRAPVVSREYETSPANRGLAEASAA